LSWSWTGSRQAGLRNLYGRLLGLRRRWFPLAKSRGHRASLLKVDNAVMLRLDRTISSDDGNSQLVVCFNLDSRSQRLPQVECPEGCPLLQSEDSRFGGARNEAADDDMLLPFEFWIFGPSRWSER
jgi:hypothetical protein